MALARRTYLYSLMHVVFGGALTRESAQAVLSAQTLEALDAVVPLEADGHSLRERLYELRACVEKTQGKAADEAFLESLRSDFTRLFQVPGDAYVHPWESPYVGKEAVLFQESTLDVRASYHEAGFKLQGERHFPDDHIAAMMDFLGRMSQRAYEAYADGRDAQAAKVLRAQRRFLQKHVLTWVDVFAEKVGEHDAHAFYGAFAGGMAALSHIDCEYAAQLADELSQLAELA